MDNELGYSLPSPTIQLKILLKVPQADVFVFNIVHCVKSKRYVDLILFFFKFIMSQLAGYSFMNTYSHIVLIVS